MGSRQRTDVKANRYYDRNTGKEPLFNKPELFGYYSIDKDRQYHNDFSQFKYLRLPQSKQNLGLDLNHGIELVKRKPEPTNEQINNLLKFISLNLHKLKETGDKVEADGKLLCPDFICLRGLLRLLMCTPYENKQDWIILATKYKGSIYLCAKHTDRELFEIANRSADLKRILSYGFKFEQYLLTDDPTVEPNTTIGVDENEELNCIFRSKLNQHKLLYGAEMDGIESDEKLDLDTVDWRQLNFVELKVKKKGYGNYEQYLCNTKYQNWWCQSYLVGIEKIFYGERDDNGIVDKIDSFNTRDILQMNINWSNQVCLQFAGKFLDMVANKMHNIDCPKTVFKFDWNPKGDRKVYCTEYRGSNPHSFVHDWYIKAIHQTSSQQPKRNNE